MCLRPGRVTVSKAAPSPSRQSDPVFTAVVLLRPPDIRRDGGVARMSDPSMITAIKGAVTIPVMAKARIGHFVEAQILEALDVDYVDESEVGVNIIPGPEICRRT